MSRPLRPHAIWDHGPEHQDEVSCVGEDWRPSDKDEILASDAFRKRLGEMVRDEMSDHHARVLANLAHELKDETAAGKYIADFMRPLIESVIEWIREDERISGRNVR